MGKFDASISENNSESSKGVAFNTNAEILDIFGSKGNMTKGTLRTSEMLAQVASDQNNLPARRTEEGLETQAKQYRINLSGLDADDFKDASPEKKLEQQKFEFDCFEKAAEAVIKNNDLASELWSDISPSFDYNKAYAYCTQRVADQLGGIPGVRSIEEAIPEKQEAKIAGRDLLQVKTANCDCDSADVKKAVSLICQSVDVQDWLASFADPNKSPEAGTPVAEVQEVNGNVIDIEFFAQKENQRVTLDTFTVDMSIDEVTRRSEYQKI